MDAEFWHQRWQTNEIGFHNKETNPLLIKYFGRVAVTEGERVFLPLCGKTLDIAWLLDRGYRVAGVELSEMAIGQLFSDLGREPKISRLGKFKRYSDVDIDIFAGDIFNLSGEILGAVDAIYDRAALVALPEVMRQRYSSHLMEITGRAPQLLICFEYDQGLMNGPPFSVSHEEVEKHYRHHYELTQLASVEVAGGLKGKCAAEEKVWLLRNT